MSDVLPDHIERNRKLQRMIDLGNRRSLAVTVRFYADLIDSGEWPTGPNAPTIVIGQNGLQVVVQTPSAPAPAPAPVAEEPVNEAPVAEELPPAKPKIPEPEKPPHMTDPVRKSVGLNFLDDDELEAEQAYWEARVARAESWGATPTLAAKYAEDCKKILARRRADALRQGK